MIELTIGQKLELKEALVVALIGRADSDGKILECNADEFADKIMVSFEKRLHERLSLKRWKLFLN